MAAELQLPHKLEHGSLLHNQLRLSDLHAKAVMLLILVLGACTADKINAQYCRSILHTEY